MMRHAYIAGLHSLDTRVECSERRKAKVIHLEATVYEHAVYSFWEVKDEISHE